MIDLLSRYPFLFALAGAMVIELSAILLRCVAHIMGGWLWLPSGILSIVSWTTLTWSFLWANRAPVSPIESGAGLTNFIGAVLVVIGGIGFLRALLTLGRASFFPWPGTRLVKRPPYQAQRRPMILSVAAISIGVALLNARLEGWIWFCVWFLLVQPLAELEEWEMGTRLPDARKYLERTPRYVRWLRR